jgi:hypothetical protein
MNSHATQERIALLADQATTLRNAALSTMYRRLATERFASLSEDELRPRIRAYDNNQRFTFGRAQTSMMPIARFLGAFDLDWLCQLNFGGPDESFFPAAWSDDVFSSLPDILSFSIRELLASADVADEEAMVTVFAHRTLVRPGGSYPGFFHHDLFPPPGRIGTAVWYPSVASANIQGAELYAYTASQDVPLDVLRQREPDFKFAVDIYNDAVMIMRYPYNVPHGVTPGVNPRHPEPGRSAILRDFLEPAVDCFVKDLVIITVSDRSPVEQ